jgi:hypothetical protein
MQSAPAFDADAHISTSAREATSFRNAAGTSPGCKCGRVVSSPIQALPRKRIVIREGLPGLRRFMKRIPCNHGAGDARMRSKGQFRANLALEMSDALHAQSSPAKTAISRLFY